MTSRRKLLLRLSAGLLLTGAVLLTWPLPISLRHSSDPPPLKVTDRTGALLYEVRGEGEGSRETMPYAEFPPRFLEILIATEDRNFRNHPGVSVRAIARAAWQNLTAGRVVSGASTLTQQFVRIRTGRRAGSLPGKAWEAFLALKVDLAMSKDEILEAYVNGAYFGHQAYGLVSASRTYFGKHPGELSLGESALLVGLLQSPSALDPFANRAGALQRRERVLDALVREGLLSQPERDSAAEEPLRLARGTVPIKAPHFVFWALDRAGESLHGLRELRTTLDLDLQTETERIVEYQLSLLKDRNVTSAAVVVLDAENGDILAMVGSADYFDAEHDGSVNVAVSARQPGSALKPFTYALALEQGDTAATTVADVESQFFTQDGNPYVPRNYDYSFHGLVRYREALANSYNVAAVKVLERVGVERLLHLLRAAGISTLAETPEHYGLALTLGDGEVRPLELAEAFGVFARAGRTLSARVTADEVTPAPRRVLDERVAWIVSDILSDPDSRLEEFGPENPLTFPWKAAAKTGTTRNSRDNWTVGFTADRIVAVWVGNADNSPMKDTSGITGAAPIFHDVLIAAMRDTEPRWLSRPSGITELSVCKLSGLLPTELCPHRIREYFVQGTEPREQDALYQSVRIDARNGLLAGEACGDDVTEKRVFVFFPRNLETWARENGWARPPSAYSPLCPGTTLASGSGVHIVTPANGDAFQLDPLVPNEREHVIFTADADGSPKRLRWYINGEMAGEASPPSYRFSWQPSVGTWTIRAETENGSDSVRITVESR